MPDTRTQIIALIYAALNRDPALYADPMQPDLFAELGADSLDAVEITMVMEDEFRISISDDEAEPFGDRHEHKTVGDWVELVEAKLAAKREVA